MPQNGIKIGLALGSGAARGLSYIGVLKVLEREGIRVDMIAGTSIGALIGAFYAAGVPLAHLEEVALNVDWRQMLRLVDPIFPSSGLIDGKKVSRFIAELLPAHTFEELSLPLAVVATDVESGESLVIRRGDLLTALRAAIAFPGIFTPVRFGSRFLVDGGLCNPVPVDVARSLGADAVIGVCAIPRVQKPSETFLPSRATPPEKAPPKPERFTSGRVEQLVRELMRLNGRNGSDDEGARLRRPPGILRVCAQSVAIMENEINDLRLRRERIDLLIRPELDGITLLEFHRAAEAIRAGEKAAERSLERLRALGDPSFAPPAACDMLTRPV